MKIKICGITRFDDAQAAIDSGADLLGFNFYPKSPRYLEPFTAARLIEAIRAWCSPVEMVGVFVNSPVERVIEIMEACGIELAQLSGEEPPEALATLNGRAFKALKPKDSLSLVNAIQRYPPKSGRPAYLLDAYRPGEYGGTGQTADWILAQAVARSYPILLAGGLSPENVAEAIRQVNPWGVDVASGVEASPGRKDHARMAAFIRAAKQTSDIEEAN